MRFLFRSPSSPPKTPSPRLELIKRLEKSQHAAGQGSHANSMAKCQLAASEIVVSTDLGMIVDNELNIQGKNSVKVNEQLADNEDFSGTGSYITMVPAEEGDALLRTYKFPPKDLSLENIIEENFSQENLAAASHDLSSENLDGKIITQEFSTSSAQDDRLHWDLNFVMETWVSSFDCLHADYLTNVADVISEHADSDKHSDKNGNSKCHESQWEAGGTNDDIGRELKRLVHKAQVSNVEEDKLDACNDNGSAIFSHKKMLYSEIDHVPNDTNDLVKETKSLYNHKRITPNAGSVSSILAKHSLGFFPSAIVNENASVNCVYFHITGNCENLSSHPVGGMYFSVDYSPPLEFGHPMGTSLFEENRNAASMDVSIVNGIDESAGGDDKRITGLHDDGLVINNMVGMGTGQPLGNEPLDDVKENFVLTSRHATAKTDTQVHINAEEPTTHLQESPMALLEPPSGLSSHDACKHYPDDVVHCKVAVEVPLENGYDSDVS
ncbi:hypothetical protein F0562_011525 [Nyssa sinensis]|uniref:Uncharacterized protein n=1 Tax=Nyssa sinensis TaxID=561372 RepID=A0A5J4ZTY4_9ASTE|nr:hypothetical protein F0562_011525 [Nyssa sinensis]